jgi:hypothetical protein
MIALTGYLINQRRINISYVIQCFFYSATAGTAIPEKGGKHLQVDLNLYPDIASNENKQQQLSRSNLKLHSIISDWSCARVKVLTPGPGW